MINKISSFMFFATLVFLTGLTGCRNKTPEVTLPSKLTMDSCSSDQRISYDIYIPSHLQSCSKFPMILVLDPHGDADGAVSRFTSIGENYGCVLVSTSSIKNDIPDFMLVMQRVISDVRSKYGAGDKVYLAGFSGGARMSIAYAQENPVNGLVVCGALASDEDIRNCKVNLFAIAGMVDFNFGESARFVLNPSQSPDNLFLEINDEVHEWPSVSALKRAFGAVFLSNPPNNKDCFPVKKLSKDYLSAYNAYCDSLISNKEFIRTSLDWNNLQRLNILKTGSDFTGKPSVRISCKRSLSAGFNEK